jgi:hypothetical protein
MTKKNIENLFSAINDIRKIRLENFNTKKLLEEISFAKLIKEYFQYSDFRFFIKEKKLEDETYKNLNILKNSIDLQIEYYMELYPKEEDFNSIMKEYEKLDPKAAKYYKKHFGDFK